MIRYDLICDQEHGFDSWFQSADAYDKLAASGMVVCGVCGSKDVSKAIMTPSVRPSRKEAKAPPKNALSNPQSKEEAALSAVRKHVEENADYVGSGFASEARAIHDGEAPERAIYGEAKPAEAAEAFTRSSVSCVSFKVDPACSVQT